MNPSNNQETHETAGMQLPPPVIEQAGSGELPPEGFQPAVETGRPAAPERAPSGNSAPATMPAIPLPLPPVLQPQRQTDDVSATTQTAGLQASDDSDLIEKEWVNKAKQIVEKTRDDPYKQSEELTVVKVDYMKKRYNKTLKLNK